jgi:hypothetical protein
MRTTVHDLLMEARGGLPHRPGPADARAAQAKGALLADIRGDDQRRAGRLVHGALAQSNGRTVRQYRVVMSVLLPEPGGSGPSLPGG